MANTTTVDCPRIYVACLASYNAGTLHGVWIDADQDAEEIQESIAAMLRKSPEPIAEDWAIHDHEGFGTVELSEYQSLESVSAMGQGIAEHGEVFAEYCEHIGDDTGANFSDAYLGQYDSLADYARESYGGDVPSGLEFYIDWEAMGRDWESSGIFTIEEGNTLHVFDNTI